MTFATAAKLYSDFRVPSKRDADFIFKIITQVGHKFIDEINQNDLVKAANELYPGTSNASKNRSVLRPAAAVLHYAAKNDWCKWLRIQHFKENSPKPRFVMPEVEVRLHAGLRVKGTRWRVNKRLLLLWLFRQGDRISDALRAKYEDCDLENNLLHKHISKNDTYVTIPLDETISRYLKLTGIKQGRIFIWETSYGAQRWIKNLSKKTGVKFTAHMARHTLGKRLNDAGVAVRTIMATLGHKDMKSSMRYQTTDLETIRRAKKAASYGSKNGS